LVNADGTVADVRVKSADHPAFANAAVAAVQSWCFQPVFRDAVPIASRAAIPFHFESSFDQRLNAVFKRKVYRSLPQPALSLQEFGSEPKPDKKIEPVYPKELMRSGLSGHVRIEFVIAPDGSTLNPRIQGKPWKGFVPAAIAAVAAATYEPPVKEGKGVYVAMIKTVRLVPPRINRERVGLRPYPPRRRYRFLAPAGCGQSCTGW
jgi:TonB family protein